MGLLESVEAALVAAEIALDDAIGANSGAILAQLETQVAVELAQLERDRVQAAKAALIGAPLANSLPSPKDGVVEAGHKDVPAPKPQPQGPACPSCSQRGTLAPSVVEIQGREITVTACSHCSHQVWT